MSAERDAGRQVAITKQNASPPSPTRKEVEAHYCENKRVKSVSVKSETHRSSLTRAPQERKVCTV